MAGFNRDFNGDGESQVFDGSEEETEVESSNLPMLIVAVVLVLVAFGGVVWVAYNNGVARGRGEAIMTAAPAQGGEAPVAATGDGDLPTPAPPVKPYQQKVGEDAAPPPVAAKKTPPPPTLRQEAGKPPPAEAKQPAKAQPKPPPAKPAATRQAAAGGYVLQIGAYKSQSEADAAWNAFRAKHKGLVSGYASDIEKADLGAKGVWYRLRIAGFADKDAAVATCGKLKAQGGACFPVK